ncbi:MAG TPA: FAD-binding oxidoreductase [Steroidobacteraceae bacterium]|nr:FAD-binding oxidoreductase [Steroidobacteraceae bacterium]
MIAGGAELREQLRSLLGPEGFVADEAARAPYLSDHRRLYHGRALAVVRPGSVAEVARVLALCNAAGAGVVPHGGNTSYCGGATPDESGRQVVVALERLNRIREIDPANDSLVAEAGCRLAQVQAAAEAAERFFPLSLGSEGSCQIGGNLSTNAGGTNVLRYGMMRELVLGLEVVLADGRVLEALSGLRKDNTGYDVKSLFLGAEGTLGIITAASLRLFPRQRAHATALIAVPDVRAAVALLARVRAGSSERASSFELMPRGALELTVRHIEGVSDPFGKPYPWYVLCELSASRAAEALTELLTEILGGALAAGEVLDAVIAGSERERLALWKMRENIPEAQRREGAGLKHDISVPVSRLADFVARAGAWIATAVPEGQLIAYGHAGDGNLHFNVSARPGADVQRFLARGEPVRRFVHDLVRECGGSFSAEHGIGRLKVEELERYTSPVELAVMRALKETLDPRHIMNPGKVLRCGEQED